LLLLATLAAAAVVRQARAEDLVASPGQDSRLMVHVYKRGLFSGFAHDHHFEVGDWQATARIPERGLEATSVEVVAQAGSLHDRQESLSEADRRKVDAQAAGPEVLDAAHHPRVEFRATRLELAPRPGDGAEHVRGVLHGALTLRGRSAPADVQVEAERVRDGWRVRGRAKVRQSALGIRPFSGFGGTVGVKDELEIELALALRPRAPVR
jgi:polyisoprenoid-binding protein YceI